MLNRMSLKVMAQSVICHASTTKRIIRLIQLPEAFGFEQVLGLDPAAEQCAVVAKGGMVYRRQ